MAAGLREIALLFLRLGATAFGGPAAHIAIMEDEVVRRRGWLTRERFLDLLGATNLIPGPNSTELAIHIGHARAGWPGLLVAGACFIAPATVIVMALSWAYVRFGALPQAEQLLYGVKPVIIAVVAQALWTLGRAALKDLFRAGVLCAAAGAALAGVSELLVIAAAGAVVAAGRGLRRPPAAVAALLAFAAGFPSAGAAAAGAAAAGAAPFSLAALALAFLKIGSVLFGSGYVLLAFLRADFVHRLGWLTEGQLLDAVAIGQVTPGPVFTTATFVGYLMGGPVAALVATAAIFLPAFVFVAVSGPLVPRIRRSRTAGAFLDGVIVGSLALMAVVTWRLAGDALVDPPTVGLAIVAGVLLLRYRINSAWLVLAGAIIGTVVGFLR